MQKSSLSNKRLLVVGDMMLDRYWFGDATRISPEAPVPVVRVQRTEERLGGAANVALNVRSLGSDVTLMSVILHSDLNCFYASVEMNEAPALKGKRRN